METLGFVRHGITDWNMEKRFQGQLDIPLNDQGRAQARALAQRLGQEAWDVIYASDLSRARETAEICGAALGLKVQTDERLREVYYGLQEGSTHEERLAQYGDRYDEIDWKIEAEEAVIARAKAAVEQIIANHPGERILVFSHAELIEVIVPVLLHQPIVREVLDNTSLSVLIHQDGQWFQEQFNCTAHLEGH